MRISLLPVALLLLSAILLVYLTSVDGREFIDRLFSPGPSIPIFLTFVVTTVILALPRLLNRRSNRATRH